MKSNGGIKFTQMIPVKYETDVMVAGGGPSGIAAALSAARQYKKVYLAEAQSCFGGMNTAGMLPMFCPFSDGVNFLSEGIGREVVKRCVAEGAAADDPRSLDEKFASYLTILPEAMKSVYDEMILESGIEFSLLTQVIGVLKDRKENVSAVYCSSKGGIFAVKAKVFIDCTGDGDLAAMAGAKFQKGDDHGNMMAGSLCSLWSGIDWSKEPIKKWNDGRFLEKAFSDGVFTVEDPGLPGMYRMGKNTGAGNIGHSFGVDGTDEISLTNALINIRKRLKEYKDYYSKYLEGYENLELMATAPMFGIREGRRIEGDYILSGEDFVTRAVFEDEIGRYCYYIDLHPAKAGIKAHVDCQTHGESLRYGPGESYGIPYRILTPKGLENVLTAGRCVSCDRDMLGSVRVMPACFITGQAAGIAAALMVERDCGTRGFNVEELQKRLKEMGAYLPNFEEGN